MLKYKVELAIAFQNNGNSGSWQAGTFVTVADHPTLYDDVSGELDTDRLENFAIQQLKSEGIATNPPVAKMWLYHYEEIDE